MATSIAPSSVFLLIISIAATTFTSHAYNNRITKKDVEEMCYSTEYAEQCQTFLMGIHATERDAKSLAQTAVKVGSEMTFLVRGLFLAKDKETHNRKSKTIYDSCLQHYYYAVRNMEDMNRAMDSNAGNVSDAHLKKAYVEVLSCQKLFHEGDSDHLDMKKQNHEVGVAISAARAAVDNLEKQ